MNDKPVKSSVPSAATDKLLSDIRNMIKEARAAVAATVNAGLTMLYWRIGGRVGQEVPRGARVEYGKRLSRRRRDNWRWNMEKGFQKKTSAT
ncbi:MAG: DUF1016 N-terminal domain-containing protein [Desulfobacterales bacterium]|nr:DUF1016 N-terminal domain-containing protein [Desulfobacterales bacterium]MDD3081861.1 DUF1016 N-terminal domain-containing protein [Desulfobacterales bacterium]MDD3950838.1 DUF1016 N-terminal domain-containing protein [Desulfobacterales bacterium]MDD4463005.1 DUF1016 N-terminal domain-containing protein [Desulfobacterales bacterium]MDY0377872.1 DUF1016 N-terminal domain-containing protein [Desulfobacterales bacterium]